MDFAVRLRDENSLKNVAIPSGTHDEKFNEGENDSFKKQKKREI